MDKMTNLYHRLKWDYIENKNCNVKYKTELSCKKIRIFGFHLVLALPSKFWATFRLPTNLDDWNTASLKLLHVTIHDFNWFLDEMHCFVNANIFKGNMEVFLCKAFLQIRNMKCRMNVAKLRR
ncbi:hypothetical protein HanRHA438_Chr08g0354061 [Helianthus annuus]|nr:hypothetical protein HanRHA438_Chr08g0354061 [Helianthus annuus]